MNTPHNNRLKTTPALSRLRVLAARYMQGKSIQMSKLLTLLVLVSCFCAPSWAEEYKCKEHKHFLVLEAGGYEHVNHHLLVDGETLIKELEEAMWFIEEVSCTNDGFKVVASHVQYGDPTKQEFTIKVIGKGNYEIK